MVSRWRARRSGAIGLVELFGRGGMGEVWRAHDTVTDRVVAIKVLPANLSEDEDFQKRFRREAHAAARLNTPHVVPIYDYGEIDGRLFVSMRLIEGRDLDTVLADGPLEPARAVRIIDQVAKALHAAHKVGLIHRDIKPSNILLDDDDFAYLIDFGIARVTDDTRMTKTGSTIGTFAYIAPERLDGRAEEDARADIYSLACVLYEALTGEPPFAGSTTTAADVCPRAYPAASTLDHPTGCACTVRRGDRQRDGQRTRPAVCHHRRAGRRRPRRDHRPDSATDTAVPRRSSHPPRRTTHDRNPRPARGHRRPPNSVRNRLPTMRRSSRRPPRRISGPPRRSATPAPPTPPRQPWWRRRAIVIPAALVTVAVIVAAIVITSQQHTNSNGPQITLPTSQTTTAQPAPSGSTTQSAPPAGQSWCCRSPD